MVCWRHGPRTTLYGGIGGIGSAASAAAAPLDEAIGAKAARLRAARIVRADQVGVGGENIEYDLSQTLLFI